MPQYSRTTSTLLFSTLASSLTLSRAFIPQIIQPQPQIQPQIQIQQQNGGHERSRLQHKHDSSMTNLQYGRHTKRAASLSTTLYNDEQDDNNNISSTLTSSASYPMSKLGEQVRMVQVAYIEDQQQLLQEQSDLQKENLAKQAKRKRRVVLDVKSGVDNQTFLTFDYRVDLPLSLGGERRLDGMGGYENMNNVARDDSMGDAVSEKVSSSSSSLSSSSWMRGNMLGLSLRQIQNGELSEESLDLDTLRYVTLEEEVMRQQRMKCSTGDEGEDGSLQILDEKRVQQAFWNGIVVSSVERGGIAWNLGIRAGDVLVATSATLGDKLWPKSTLEGVRSVITSRKVMSKTMQVQFQRVNEMADQGRTSELVQEFEMSLTRPMGIHIEDTQDGYVRISGFTDDAPEKVIQKLKVGDRIIAVDSSLGNKMWPVSNVEGVVSAVTTRLPGQPVQIRFERVVEEGADLKKIQSLTSDEKKNIDKMARNELASQGNVELRNVELLSRCRNVLSRYIQVHDKAMERSAAVPALVADRVLESLAESSLSLDPATLSLVMNAYIICDKPAKALETFEAAVGFKADGSPGTPEVKIVGRKSNNGGIVPTKTCVNICTVTDVIRAHAQMGNGNAAVRVLAAVEGVDLIKDGTESQKWGEQLKADTKCYNAALAAVVNSKDISVAEELFQKMRPKKDLVSYNTMIGAYARAGMRKEAYNLFKTMKNSGIKPDKVTITALIKAVLSESDFDSARQLLKDMKKAGISADVVSYNTVIQALCAKSKWFEAKELVADMEANGILPNSKTYGLLMNGLLKLKKPGPCLTLFESACADQRTAGLMENVHLYTTAITAAASLGDSERAFELLSRMNFSGVKPNIKTLTALMGACISDDKHSFALDVYKKMKSPDGYAQYLAIRAYSGLGDFESALKMVKEKGQLSGKQTMMSYNNIIGSALNKRDYKFASVAMENLLRRGFIPSKDTLQIIVNTMGLFETKQSIAGQYDNRNNDGFKFLLNVLDAIHDRKLQVSGQFYAGILLEGARLGGLERKMASLISSAKGDISRKDVHFEDSAGNNDMKGKISWSKLFENYSDFRDQLENISLPTVRVQVTGREIRQVLSAERAVSYSRRLGQRAKIQV